MQKLKPHQWVITIICCIIMFLNPYFPPLFGLNSIGMSVICIFAATIVMLLTVSLTWPVLLMIAAFPTCGVYTISQALQMTWGHSVVCFMIFNMAMLEVMRQTGVLRRIAVNMITSKIAKRSPFAFLCCLWGAGLLLCSVIDVTASIILFTSLAAEILATINIKKEDNNKLAVLIMMGLMMCVGLGYGVTPIGHPTAIATIGLFADYGSVSILQYSIVGYVIAIIFFVLFVLIMKYVYKVDTSALADFDADSLKASMPPMSKSEKYSLVVFIAVVVLWLLPDVTSSLMPTFSAFLSKYGTVTAPMLGCVAMCVISVDNKPMMDFPKALKDGLSWPALTVVMASMMLSAAMTNPDAGIVAMLSEKLTPLIGNMSPVLFVFLMGMLCTVITNFTSCTIAAMIPAAISIALVAGNVISGVNMQALCVAIGINEAYAFCVAPAGTVAAVTTGLGWVPPKVMLKDGGILALVFGAITSIVAYGVGCLVF